jgi:transposase
MRRTYPSDLSREVFAKKVQSGLEKARKKTKPRTVELDEVFCGILYVLKSGCQWRMLPADFPKWRTCYDYFQQWGAKGEHGHSRLEEAVKKWGWRGPTKPGAERENTFPHR